jgi:hypothetical protein
MYSEREVYGMFSTEILLAYDEYLIDCEWEGITPMPLFKWLASRED